ncbi:DMT family transporter [Cohnella massiliensis]|uniref:DMT family transporter n=1 Tax=Cohnella massiliensis TaxID=1816691 RepID=UPI0009BBE2C0|nr:DMT family transporter [Cohnella massiliensis]
MWWFTLAVGSAVVFGLAGLFMKVSQMRRGSTTAMLLGLYASGTCGFWLQAAGSGGWTPFDYRIWIAGAVIGLGSAWGNLLFMKALDCGPASLTSPLTNSNIVLVVAMGAFFYEEAVSLAGIAGVVSLLAAVVLLSVKPGAASAEAGKRWFALVIAATLLFAFRNGGLKVTAEMGLDNASVLWSGYLLSFLWFAAATAAGSRRSSAGRSAAASFGSSSVRTGLAWGLAAGIGSYGGLQLYSAALLAGPSHLVAPIFATNSLVVALGSLLIFKEKLGPLQRVAFLLLMAGLALVRI